MRSPNASVNVLAGGVPAAAPTYQLTDLATLTAAFVRVRWTADAATDTIIGAGINLTEQ